MNCETNIVSSQETMMDTSLSHRDLDSLSVSTTQWGDSSVTDSSNKFENSQSDDEQMIYVSPPIVAEREQHAIRVTKIILFVVLLLAVVAVASVTYLMIVTQEQNDFENKVLNIEDSPCCPNRTTAHSCIPYSKFNSL